MAVVGGICIVLGGLVAAVTDPLQLPDGSWLAAYLVLVGGVAQVAMGWARTWDRAAAQASPLALGHLVAWNLGHVGVIGGTLTGESWLVDLGSMLLVVALAIALHAVRRRDSGVRGTADRPTDLVLWIYRGLLVVLVISIPIGVALSHLRHG